MSEDPRVGTELAGHRIESLLGFGGTSVDYLARDLRLERRVALELLAESLAEDASFRDQEAAGVRLPFVAQIARDVESTRRQIAAA